MNQFEVISIIPGDDPTTLRDQLRLLATNSELRSIHRAFYEAFEKFVQVFCKDMLPEGFKLNEWESAIFDELEFVSQFYLLETSYFEPSRGYKM